MFDSILTKENAPDLNLLSKQIIEIIQDREQTPEIKAQQMSEKLQELDSTQRFDLLQIQNERGQTPLYLAAYQNNPALITALLNGLNEDQQSTLLGIKTSEEFGENTPLHIAAHYNNPNVIMAMLGDLKEYLSWVIEARNKRGENALCIAARYNNVDTITAILGRFNPAKRYALLGDSYLSPPVTEAIKNGNSGAIAALLDGLSVEECAHSLFDFDNKHYRWDQMMYNNLAQGIYALSLPDEQKEHLAQRMLRTMPARMSIPPVLEKKNTQTETRIGEIEQPAPDIVVCAEVENTQVYKQTRERGQAPAPS